MNMEIPDRLATLAPVAKELGGALMIWHRDVVVLADQPARDIHFHQDWSGTVTFEDTFRAAIKFNRIDDPIILRDPDSHLSYARVVRAREQSHSFVRRYDGIDYSRHHVGLNWEWNAQVWVRVERRFGDEEQDFPSANLCEYLEHRRALVRLTTAIDQVGIAMAMVDREGHVVNCTPLMAQHLSKGVLLWCDTDSRLTCGDSVRTTHLYRALDSVMSGQQAAALVPNFGVDAQPIGVMSSPSDDGTCIVVISSTATKGPLVEILRDAYGLTPREAEVLVRLGQGETVKEISEATNRQIETTRSLIANAKSKIGQSRQHNLAHIVTRAAVLFGGISPKTLSPLSRRRKI